MGARVLIRTERRAAAGGILIPSPIAVLSVLPSGNSPSLLIRSMDRPDRRQAWGVSMGNPAKTAPLGHSRFETEYASNAREICDNWRPRGVPSQARATILRWGRTGIQ
jgi:hypothetical protein